jgi:hypothetical protein
VVSVGNFATVLSTLGYDVWNVDFETPIIEQGRWADFDHVGNTRKTATFFGLPNNIAPNGRCSRPNPS